MSMPTRWSYSSITTYEDCPARWKYDYLLNLPTEPSAPMVRGSRLHKYCEDYLNGDYKVLPWELTKVSKTLGEMKQIGAKAEEIWLLNKDWEPVSDPAQAWIKTIVDVHWTEKDVVQIIDFKSGREYPEHREQLELYAIVGMKVYPEAKRAEYKALYLDSGHSSNDGAIIREMVSYKQESWTKRAIKIWEDKEFTATPSKKACMWCDHSKKKGGPCEEGV